MTSAPVTKRHRLLASRADWRAYGDETGDGLAGAPELLWIDTGQAWPAASCDRIISIAQALADIEAEALARSQEEREHLLEAERQLLATLDAIDRAKDWLSDAEREWLATARSRKAGGS